MLEKNLIIGQSEVCEWSGGWNWNLHLNVIENRMGQNLDEWLSRPALDFLQEGKSLEESRTGWVKQVGSTNYISMSSAYV